jgi:hypothetical protein
MYRKVHQPLPLEQVPRGSTVQRCFFTAYYDAHYTFRRSCRKETV